MKSAPTYDCLKRFRLTRPTRKFFSLDDQDIVRAPEIAGAHAQHADIGAADGAGQLDAGVDRHLLAAKETDLPAEKRVHVGAGRGNASRRFRARAREAEDTRPLQEERSLLGKQHGEARQVDLARVDFRFAEVGVDGRGQLQAGRDVVEHVEAGLAVAVAPAAGAQQPPREERADVETDPLRQADEIGDLARLRHLVELRVQPRAGPAVLLQLSIDVPGDVEAPHRLSGRKAQALERNRELRDPSLVGAPGAHVPDRVPLGVQLSARDEAVHERARRIGREVERAALVAERVEQDLDAVVGGEAGIARHLRADDPPGLGVVRDDADVEVVAVVQQRDLGSFRRRPPGQRLPLNQVANLRRHAPDRLVQHAVDGDGLGDRGHDRRARGLRRRQSPGRATRLSTKVSAAAAWD